MWFVHSCLAFHGTCKPQSWVDLGELAAGSFLAVMGAFGFFAGLACLGG